MRLRSFALLRAWRGAAGSLLVRRSEIQRLRAEVTQLRERLRLHVPCQACGWAHPRPPLHNEEPPIVKAGLDAINDKDGAW